MNINPCSGIILGRGSVNERRRYNVTPCNAFSHWPNPYTEWSLISCWILLRKHEYTRICISYRSSTIARYMLKFTHKEDHYNRCRVKEDKNIHNGQSQCLGCCWPSWWRKEPRHRQREIDQIHDYVIKWKHFPRYWPFVRGIHRSPVNSPHKGQWRGASMFSLICAWIKGWVNHHEAGGVRRHRAHYYVTVMLPRIFRSPHQSTYTLYTVPGPFLWNRITAITADATAPCD